MEPSAADVAVTRFMQTGWEEVGTLGRGARGPVLSVRKTAAGGDGQLYALKRSSWEEVSALKSLASCRNVIALHEQFVYSSEVCARLECMEGGSLRSYLRAKSPSHVPEDAVRYVISQVLEGLEDIHRKGWMHRDVKAENIGLSCEPSSLSHRFGDCVVKLLDFDVAVEVPSRCLTEVIGTVENMAPEVFQGSYDERADCWSVGVITYEALYGYRPFNDACVDRVEEMVRNWHRYLLFPLDAAELPSSFIRTLLCDTEDRLTSSAAKQHRWVCSMGLPSLRSGGLAATGAGNSPVRAQAKPQDNLLGWSGSQAMPAKSRTDKAIYRQLSEEDSQEAEQFALGSGEAVESLSQLRRNLTQWNQSLLDRHFDASATPSVSSTARDDLRRKTVQMGTNLGHLEPANLAERRTQDLPAMGSSSPEESRGASQDAADDPDRFHQRYLQTIREKTQEMVRAAAELSAKQADDAPRERADSDVLNNGSKVSFTDVGTKQVPTEARDEAPVGEEPLHHLHSHRKRTQELLMMLSQASESQNMPVQEKTSTAEGISFLPTPPPRPKDGSRRSTTSLLSNSTPIDRSGLPSHSMSHSMSEGPCSTDASPLGWLASQKHRMDRLLLSLQSANEDAQVLKTG